MLLLSAPSVAASPVGEFGFWGLRKPHESEFDFKGPCGAHLVRQKSWKCDHWAGQGPCLFPVIWLNPRDGLGWGLSYQRMWLSLGFRVSNNQYFHVKSTACILPCIHSDKHCGSHGRHVGHHLALSGLSPQMAPRTWGMSRTSFPCESSWDNVALLTGWILVVVVEGRSLGCEGLKPGTQACFSQIHLIRERTGAVSCWSLGFQRSMRLETRVPVHVCAMRKRRRKNKGISEWVNISTPRLTVNAHSQGRGRGRQTPPSLSLIPSYSKWGACRACCPNPWAATLGVSCTCVYVDSRVVENRWFIDGSRFPLVGYKYM